MLPDVYRISLAVLFLVAIYVIRSYRAVKQMDEGTAEMSHLASRIRSGSSVFEKTIFKRIVPVSAILAFLLCLFIEKFAGLAFLGGLVCTTVAVVVGMSVATFTNVRSAATALKNVNEPKSVSVARTVNTTVRGSKICGIIVHASVLFGLALVAIFTGIDPHATGSSIIPMQKAVVVPIVARLTAYSLGWSVVAMFCRVAGGIFTKAADIGADLIGKVFMHFDEDDPRNPAVLADLTGDNVNDIAGNQADLGESFAATPVTAIIAAVNLFGNNPALLESAIAFAFFLALGGLISSIIGLHYASSIKESEDPGRQLNISMYIAVAGTLLTSLIASWRLFGDIELSSEFGNWISPFLASAIGIVSGAGVGLAAKSYTDLKSRWAIRVAEMAKKGTGLCVSMSLIAGLISCFSEIMIVAFASFVAYTLAGLYGLTIMALGMFSFVAQPIAADAFGPISDNAGGIAEACGLPEHVREITDLNDAAGNSSAAVGKGFAISGAAAVVVAQINTYLESYGAESLNFAKPNVVFGFLMGISLMALFCGLLGHFTLDAAGKMADECRKQLQDEDVVAGRKDPDSEKCIEISTANGIHRMAQSVLIPILSTILIGFLFGPETLGGALIGVIGAGLLLAIFTSNAGGLADNAKKRFEANLVTGYEHGTAGYDAAHDAAVHGDTMGDWQKDVVAVCVDIFMKIMGTLSIMLVPLFVAYQILPIL